MSRYKIVNGEKTQFSAEEEKEFDAVEKEWKDNQGDLNLLRQERDNKIAKTDWWASADLTMTDAQKKYRQDLRDITKTYKTLNDVKWPAKPE